MLIEQAFFNLPEIMVGHGYAEQEYEAGIVSAFSLALLQEFNGRNINNPISNIYAEKRYLNDKDKTKLKIDCTYRADLFVDLSKTNLANDKLYTYGFKQFNYIEAKFFRTGQENSTANVLAILLDLYRLTALTAYPEIHHYYDCKNKKTELGRYFLHVYLGRPEDYIGSKFNWLKKIYKEGEGSIDICLSENSSAFDNFPQDIKIKIDFTNFIIKVTDFTTTAYTFILTRINSFTLHRTYNEKFIAHYSVKNGSIDFTAHHSVVNDSIDFVKYICISVESILREFVDTTQSKIKLKDKIPTNFFNQEEINNVQQLRNKTKTGKKGFDYDTLSELIVGKLSHFDVFNEILNSKDDENKKEKLIEKCIQEVVAQIEKASRPNPTTNYTQFRRKLEKNIKEKI